MKTVAAQDAERIVAEKTTEELLAIIAHPDEWADEMFAASQVQLQKRSVPYSAPIPSVPPAKASVPAPGNKPRPILGAIILLAIFSAGVLMILSTANEWQGAGRWDPWLWVPGALLMAFPIGLLVAIIRQKARAGESAGAPPEAPVTPPPSLLAGVQRRVIAFVAVTLLSLLAYWVWNNCPY
ncbi:MAG: hypothetical protein P4N24_00880, partial [Acidobacteriota bacterium]|nr:hypothetical protein [Acidobacteriota bacterium]